MASTGDEAQPGGEPLTIAQLAERAGVSIATVSKVVNGRLDVAPDTRALIESLIRRHGYRRKRRASEAAPLLEVVFGELHGLYAVEILNGVGHVARDHNLGVVVSELHGRHTPGRGWFEDVLTRRPIGVIAVFASLTADHAERLRGRGVPLVLLDPTGDLDDGIPSVGAGNWNGGLAATRHLLALGHTRIAVLTGPPHMLSSRARLDGYRTAMDLAGVPVDPALVRIGDFQIADGRHLTRELLRLPEPPTAVFACNDAEALGVYQAATEAGLRIPDDLSVVGFDDLPMAEWNIPPLTTVRQPLREMAVSAATMLVTLAQGEEPPQRRVELATELIVRSSTAPPAKAR
ncbi:LacI family DNA-binding transcriptional regulator [Phytomonospora endophytica]|uniref:DNA-binding LacI/PurR family transcriptional regulator n=1 Tax=Phytomonospora endophytica TaxID=714109 RepID=A0A841FS57_9ACTN|nr:LacI family DNA-binding transcriptional regulator [Phytomonospora endophytica]MBB6038634.1 DNA-binding LacI/PurR family transcriptional regulator [Phytomonospora endophytica]GIG69222.1 LacI family transcriptional regulator [Phytomonospora endophytica]